MAPRPNKTGPRKKSGCLTCRSRHMRCDEARPICGACKKAGLVCQQCPAIMFAPLEQFRPARSHKEWSPKRIMRPQEERSDGETASLLRQYQDGIAVWMDLFDHQLSYQKLLLREVPTSPLLLHCICSLTARQKANLIPNLQQQQDWNAVAERHYGRALSLLRDALLVPALELRRVLPASILLSSYELMSFPGQDYTRHFLGAKSLIESHPEVVASDDPLLRSSYWIFVRHDFSVALASERPLALDNRLRQRRPASCFREDDELGNCALLHAADVLQLVSEYRHCLEGTNSIDFNLLVKSLDEWEMVASKHIVPVAFDDGKWYPTASGAAAMQIHLVARLILSTHISSVSNGTEVMPNSREYCEQIVGISTSEIADAARVQSVYCLFHTAKYTERPDLRKKVVSILEDVQQSTGFHTQSKIDALKPLR